MGSMMHMPWVVAAIIVFVIVVGGGAFAAIRIAGGKAVAPDHPRTGTPPAARPAIDTGAGTDELER